MHDFAVVHAADCHNKVVEYEARLCLGKMFFFDDDIEQFSPFAQLCHDIGVLGLFKYLVYFQDAGMILSYETCTRFLSSSI